jgi:hypothetical protein
VDGALMSFGPYRYEINDIRTKCTQCGYLIISLKEVIFMYELLYLSVSPRGLSESELEEILCAARLKNKRLGITGMLLYHDREIMQILEGDEDVVKELYKTIATDQRHSSVAILYQGGIENRSFSQWSMAFKLLDQDSVKELAAGFEEYDLEKTPLSMISDSPNRGKRTFLRLRDTL